jgi:DNA anti-recombination protein RmuC
MADVSNELIYEVLKQIQDRLGNVDSKVTELKGEMQAFRGHLVSMQQDVHNIYTILDCHDGRLGRIESQLSIAETPPI